ncbi:MAG: TaqI-like C-terminal specificity domain-containing protein, partial [bacterium]|nr:TaqI-like C-terminal specificity domain-containing protein [bacterium]
TKQNWADDAPTLKSHLYKYREIMEQRRENQNGRISYMHLHWPRDEHFFVPGEKILAVRKSVGHPIFAYTTKAAYVMMAVNVIKTNRWDMRYLTGVLNSTLVAYWLRHKGKMQGENYQIDKEPLLAIPLPDIGKLEQLPISDLVSKVLDAKKVDPDADTSAMESEIDALVYKLYGLTDEEIAVVEGKKN